MSNNSKSTFAFQKSLYFEPAFLFLSGSDQAAWSLERKLWASSSMGSHLSTLCVPLREICCPGKSFLWMAICLLKWSWALCLCAHTGSRALLGWNSLFLAGDAGASCWRPSPHRVTWSHTVCWWALLQVGVCGGSSWQTSLKDLILESRLPPWSCVTVCHGYRQNHSCLNHPARGQDIPHLPEKDNAEAPDELFQRLRDSPAGHGDSCLGGHLVQRISVWVSESDIIRLESRVSPLVVV